MSEVFVPNTKDMFRMIKAFMGVHVDNIKDEIGPNKPDAPFFQKVVDASEVKEYQYVELAQRLEKYISTQIPTIQHLAGYPPNVNWSTSLKAISDAGKKAIAIKEERERLERAIKEEQQRAEEVIKKEQQDLIRVVAKKQNIRNPSMASVSKIINFDAEQARIDARELGVIDRYIDAMIQTMENEKKRRTISVTPHEYEVVTQKGAKFDVKALKLRLGTYGFEENNRIHNELKSRIGWDFKGLKSAYKFLYDTKLMCLLRDKTVIEEAIRVLNEKWITTELHRYLHDCDDALNGAVEIEINPDDYKATLLKGGIVLSFPYDEKTVNVISVKLGKGNRSWDKASKKWSVPLHKSLDLLKLLGDEHPLSIAIRAIPEVQSYLVDKVKRIAISNAVSLDDHTEMEEKLSKVFHEGKKLYPFQYVGVKFGMLSGGAFIIGDDMGVGKTIQAIAYAALHPEQWPVLIVAPANVQYHWRKEILGWVKDATVQIVEKGTSKLEDVDFTVITYNKMNTQESNLLERGYNIVVFDESHYIKNHKAKRTQSSFKVAEQSDSIVLMSGTPIPNRPVEFYNSLCLVRPADWKGRWMNYVYTYCEAHKNDYGYLVVNGASNLEELHALTRDFMIRRLKEEVLPELPEQVRQLLPVQPNKIQMKEYRENQESWFAQYASYQNRGGMPAGFVLNMLTDLRKKCAHLKIDNTVEYLEEYRHQNNNKPIIVFAHHRDILAECGETFKARNPNSVIARITGETLAKKRQEIVEGFQAGKIDVLFCSTIAAKEGLTLTAADTTVFIEREWVSGWEEQAEARVNRIGATTDTCWAIYLTVEGTVDQHFDRVIESKRAVLKAIVDGGEEVDRVNVIEEILTSMAESATGKDKVQLESMLYDYKNGDKNNDKGAKKYE